MIKNIWLLILVGITIIIGQTNNSNYDIIVAKDGSGNFTNLQSAFNSIPPGNSIKKTIFIKKGTYYEKDTLVSGKNNIQIIGEDKDSTVITYDDYSGKPGVPSTSNSFTLAIDASDITIQNITIQNTATQAQAVALRTKGDRIILDNCKLLGFQDTYYTWGVGRVYNINCYIEGTTDFIFGRSIAVFDSCTLVSKKNSTITAANTDSVSKFGYVFRNCNILANSGITKVQLGRPWGPFAKTVFMKCLEGSHIDTSGWLIWSGNNNHLTSYYAEYKCTGGGYTPLKRVPWSYQLTDSEAVKYTLENIFSKNSTYPAFSVNWMPVIPTKIENNKINRIESPELKQNYPNPFNPVSIIKYSLSEDCLVSIKLFDCLGKEVRTLIDEVRKSGEHSIQIDAGNLSSGVYFYQMKAGNYLGTRKMLLQK